MKIHRTPFPVMPRESDPVPEAKGHDACPSDPPRPEAVDQLLKSIMKKIHDESYLSLEQIVVEHNIARWLRAPSIRFGSPCQSVMSPRFRSRVPSGNRLMEESAHLESVFELARLTLVVRFSTSNQNEAPIESAAAASSQPMTLAPAPRGPSPPVPTA